MLSVKGTFDGKKLKLSTKLNIRSPKKVIVTFLDELLSEELQTFDERGDAFAFLKNKEEDIYSDKNLKVKYK